MLLEVLMRYLSNKNLGANKETGKSLIEIYVTEGWLVAQYNCLEFKNFIRIWLLKMLFVWCQKNSLSISILLLLEVLYMEKPDDNFLNFFPLNMRAPRIMDFMAYQYILFLYVKFLRRACFFKKFH